MLAALARLLIFHARLVVDRLRRVLAAMLTGILVISCSESPPAPPIGVELDLSLAAPGQIDPSSTVYITLYHAWSGEGELRYPLAEIESFEAGLGRVSHRFNYPVHLGEGLMIFGWIDADGDGVHCTPVVRGDLSDLAAVDDFPAEKVSVSLFLEVPCVSANWFFPGPVPEAGI